MNPGIIIFAVILLVGLMVGLYFLSSSKKCADHETQDDCKEPCQWDTYGGKCIDEDEDLTPGPSNVGGGSGGSGASDVSGASRTSGVVVVGGGVPGGYKKFAQKKISSDTRITTCKTKSVADCASDCTYDPNCIAFTHDGKKCCMFNGIQKFSTDGDVDTYMKPVIGYTSDTLGNYTGDDILTQTLALEACGKSCDETAQCKGFSYKNNSCVLKGANISNSPILDGAQYYKRDAANVPGSLNCNSVATTTLNGKRVFIKTNEEHEVPNKMFKIVSRWTGDQWKDQGAVTTVNYGRTFNANDGQVATIELVPGRTDEYFIKFTYAADAREGGNKTVMMFTGNANEDGEVTWFGTWVAWNDPLCRWKFFKKEGTENDYWIVTNTEHRAPCKMLKYTEDGLRAVDMDLTDEEAIWTLDPFTAIGQ